MPETIGAAAVEAVSAGTAPAAAGGSAGIPGKREAWVSSLYIRPRPVMSHSAFRAGK